MKNPFNFFLELFKLKNPVTPIEKENPEFLIFHDNEYFLIRKEPLNVGDYAFFNEEIIEIERESIHHSLEKKIKLFDAIHSHNNIIASSKTGLIGVAYINKVTLKTENWKDS